MAEQVTSPRGAGIEQRPDQDVRAFPAGGQDHPRVYRDDFGVKRPDGSSLRTTLACTRTTDREERTRRGGADHSVCTGRRDRRLVEVDGAWTTSACTGTTQLLAAYCGFGRML